MGHYDDEYDADYARQRSLLIAKEKANKEKYRRCINNALVDLKSSRHNLGNSRQIILDHYEILELLLTKELNLD